MRRTFLPLWANPAAREIEELVFPTPPFCDAMANIIAKLNLSKTLGYFDSVSYLLKDIQNTPAVSSKEDYIFTGIFVSNYPKRRENILTVG
jgi:hypothetical protein